MPHARPSGFPSPSCVHAQSYDRGGQAPALRGKKRHFPVGLGPSDATRASERVSLAIVRATEKTSLVLFRSVGPECL